MHVIFISINQAPKAKPLYQQEYLSPSCIKYASDFSPVHLNPLPGILYGVNFRKKKRSLFNCDQLNNPRQRGLTHLLAGMLTQLGWALCHLVYLYIPFHPSLQNTTDCFKNCFYSTTCPV